jgi:hypothetical protein
MRGKQPGFVARRVPPVRCVFLLSFEARTGETPMPLFSRGWEFFGESCSREFSMDFNFSVGGNHAGFCARL